MMKMNIFKKGIRFLKENKRIPNTSEVYGFLKIKRERMPFPTFAQIEPTTRCNFNCETCTRSNIEPSRINRDLTVDNFNRIINQIPTLKTVKIQGMGEPFLNQNLEDILILGKRSGIKFNTICNGSLLFRNNNLLDFFESITVSIDSPNKKNFERIRRGSNFDTIIDNLKNTIKIKNKRKLKTELGITMVLTHKNYKELDDMINLAKLLDVDYIGFVEVENWNVPKEEDINSIEFIKKSREISFLISKKIEEFKQKNKNLKINFLSSKPRKQKCLWSFNAVFITVDGFLTPCCIRPNPEIFNFGNIYKDSFSRIWNNNKYQSFRHSLIFNSDNFICDKCPD